VSALMGTDLGRHMGRLLRSPQRTQRKPIVEGMEMIKGFNYQIFSAPFAPLR